MIIDAKPFLKWAGGKGQLLPAIRGVLPAPFQTPAGQWPKRYFEPFMGSAAVFFDLSKRFCHQRVFISDMNHELVLAFVAVRDHVEGLIELLAEHEYEHNGRCAHSLEARREYYERVRALDRGPHWNEEVFENPRKIIEHAARFIYLNKTCFNGLWRVNRNGYYNVPMGRYSKPTICNKPLLLAAHQALQDVHIDCQPYWEAVAKAEEGDLVYFDPPYTPISRTSSFTAYAKDAFLAAEHRGLAVVYLSLAARGVHVVLSNSDTAFTRLPLGAKDDYAAFTRGVEPILAGLEGFNAMPPATLFDAYREHWNVRKVYATRAINAKGELRGAITEILVSSKGDGFVRL